MAKITWLGEDDLHSDGNGPRFNDWNGVRFEVGKPVDMDEAKIDPDVKAHMIAKAKRNRFYEVSGLPGRPPKDKIE